VTEQPSPDDLAEAEQALERARLRNAPVRDVENALTSADMKAMLRPFTPSSPSPDDVASAERVVRDIAAGPQYVSGSPLCVLLREFDRLRLVEQAATALVEEWEAIRNPADKLVWTIAEQLTERLASAVHGEQA
jgi:hypothetical protein